MDFISKLVSIKALVNKIGWLLALATLILSFIHSWVWCFATILIALIVIAISSFCVVMPGYAAYQVVLGKLLNKSISAGWRLIIPYITSVTEIDVRLQKHSHDNKMMTANLREVTLKYVLTYQINWKNVHILHSKIGENDYLDNAICPWLDAAMTEVVASKTYEEINGHLGELSKKIEEAYLKKVGEQCEHIAGKDVILFENISVSITEVKFDDEYTRTVSELAKAQKEKEIVEAKAEQLQISTQAQADALRITAQAEADAMKLKGASENEVKERLGEILKSHPELLKETLAKNFPKVFGGNGATPMIDLDQLLGL